MIDSQLIWYMHYFGWADEVILEHDTPPLWVIEIATIRYYADAVKAINRFVYSEPFESFGDEWMDEYVACLFVRYQSGAISWATFLSDAGKFADGAGGPCHCEVFYRLLNVLERDEFANVTETAQAKLMYDKFRQPILMIRSLYEMFMQHFRVYVARD